MGLFDDTYLQEVSERAQQISGATPTFSPAPTRQVAQQPLSRSILRLPSENRQTFFNRRAQTIVADNQLTEKEQIEKFGGLVGSTEYWHKKSEVNPYSSVGKKLGPLAVAGGLAGLAVGGPFLSVVGVGFGASIAASVYPEDEEWDSLTTTGKLSYVQNSGANMITNMITGFPKQLAIAGVRPLISVKPTWDALVKGDVSFEDLGARPDRANVPLLGKIPTYYQLYDDAIKAGHGPLAAALSTGGTALGDVVIVGSLLGAAKAALQPRATVGSAAGGIKNIKPVQELIVRDAQGRSTGVIRTEASVAEYYSLPKSTAKEFGGNTGNTFFKVTQASSDSVELSVVRVRGGALQRGVDKLRRTETTEGSFGPEIKVQSQVVKLSDDGSQALRITGGEVAESLAQEVSKFKTAEEFANAPDIFFHGTPKAGAINIEEIGLIKTTGGRNVSKGVSVSEDFSTSKLFAERDRSLNKALPVEKRGEVFALKLKPTAKIMKADEFLEIRNSLEEGVELKASELQGLSVSEKVNLRFKRANELAEKELDSLGIDIIDFRGSLQLEKSFEGEMIIRNLDVVENLGKVPGRDINKLFEVSAVPASVTKGKGSAPVTPEQLNNLAKIGEANGLAPAMRDAVVRTVSGKSIVGEMTQAEYVEAAKSLEFFNKANQFAPEAFDLNPAPLRTGISQYISPARKWMRTYEERGGMPIYSEVYVKLEDAIKVRDAARKTWRGRKEEIAGDILKPRRLDERLDVRQYILGNKDAILKNENYTPAQKSELVKIVEGLDSLFKEAGPHLDVPPEIYLENYLPKIQNLGGIYQLYKRGAEVPAEITFFAKFKRKGSKIDLIEDPFVLFDIYIAGGTNAKFVSPVMEGISPFIDQLPGTVKDSARSYTLERLGYAGVLEEALDNMVPSMNRNLGINLPPDLGRQLGEMTLSTQYSGLLPQPGTWFRNSLQYPLFGYARLGSKFSAKAQIEVAKNPKAALRELSDEGLSIDTTHPYGGAVVSGPSSTSDRFTRFANQYKSVTQKVIEPISVGDNIQRSIIYKQFKFQFDDAVGLFNEGKINWSEFEQRINMKKFSPVDQKIARERIAAGNTKGAFDHLVRDVIDETMFPYRRGSSMRAGYGFAGKVGTSLFQWPNEAAHMASRWIKTGQWDNVIRYWASSVALKRTFEESFGLDFTQSLFLGPFIRDSLLAPIPQLAYNIYQTAINSPVVELLADSGSRKKFNDSKEEVMRTFNAIGYPAALQISNVNDFQKIIKEHQEALKQGDETDGLFRVRNKEGDVIYKTDFSGLFWGELMGFPTEEKVGVSNFLRDYYNNREKRSEAKKKGMELFQQERYEEAQAIFNEWKIEITDKDLDDYFVPVTDRVFENAPRALQEKISPQYQELLKMQNRP